VVEHGNMCAASIHLSSRGGARRNITRGPNIEKI
jgi:hypothetical protein